MDDFYNPARPLTEAQITAAASWFERAILRMPLPKWRASFQFLDNRPSIAYRVGRDIRQALTGMSSKTYVGYEDGRIWFSDMGRPGIYPDDIDCPRAAFIRKARVIFSNDGRTSAKSF